MMKFYMDGRMRKCNRRNSLILVKRLKRLEKRLLKRARSTRTHQPTFSKPRMWKAVNPNWWTHIHS